MRNIFFHNKKEVKASTHLGLLSAATCVLHMYIYNYVNRKIGRMSLDINKETKSDQLKIPTRVGLFVGESEVDHKKR